VRAFEAGFEIGAKFIGLPHRNLVSPFYSKGDQGAARVHSEDLVEAALRMRPYRVLMQELRDGAAFTFIRGIAAGHPGSTHDMPCRFGGRCLAAVGESARMG
jgi:Type II/IV secretion system protein